MEANHKKTALRMIPYGIYVLTATDGDDITAATVNWVTQTSFDPPLVVIGMKADSGACAITKKSGTFALNILGKGQQGAAFTFFKPVELTKGKISGESYRNGSTGAPLLENAVAAVECNIVEVVERGDHHIVVGEVVDAHVNKQPEGRADDATLWMRELGDNVFYGG